MNIMDVGMVAILLFLSGKLHKIMKLYKTFLSWIWSCDVIILTLAQIKYCAYNKHIPKYHMTKHYRTCVTLDTNNNTKINVDFETIRARIALKIAFMC